MKFSCIVPAYNEQKKIESVLPVINKMANTFFYEVICIDDGSTDNTKEIIKRYTNIKLIENEENLGKSKTIAKAIRQTTGDYIVMLDADLHGLTEQNILDLIEPIQKGIADVTFSFRKNGWPLWPFKKIDYCTGERVFSRKLIERHLDEMESLHSYSLEVFLNRIFIDNKIRLAVVHMPNVVNHFNQYKHGTFLGIKKILRIWWHIIIGAGIFGIYWQNFQLLKLLVKEK